MVCHLLNANSFSIYALQDWIFSIAVGNHMAPIRYLSDARITAIIPSSGPVFNLMTIANCLIHECSFLSTGWGGVGGLKESIAEKKLC